MQNNREGSESSLQLLVPLRLRACSACQHLRLQSFGSTWLCLVEGLQSKCQRLLGRSLSRLGTIETPPRATAYGYQRKRKGESTCERGNSTSHVQETQSLEILLKKLEGNCMKNFCENPSNNLWGKSNRISFIILNAFTLTVTLGKKRY